MNENENIVNENEMQSGELYNNTTDEYLSQIKDINTLTLVSSMFTTFFIVSILVFIVFTKIFDTTKVMYRKQVTNEK